jgi:hypothetical protein
MVVNGQQSAFEGKMNSLKLYLLHAQVQHQYSEMFNLQALPNSEMVTIVTSSKATTDTSTNP